VRNSKIFMQRSLEESAMKSKWAIAMRSTVDTTQMAKVVKWIDIKSNNNMTKLTS
jgi:hypothetical protein